MLEGERCYLTAPLFLSPGEYVEHRTTNCLSLPLVHREEHRLTLTLLVFLLLNPLLSYFLFVAENQTDLCLSHFRTAAKGKSMFVFESLSSFFDL